MKTFRRLLGFGFLLLLTRLPVSADLFRYSLARGVEFQQEIVPPPAGPLVINVLKVDLKAAGVKVKAAVGRDVILTDEPAKGRENIRETAQRHGAIAAINADFFPFTGDPLGLTIRDGELLSESRPNRVALALTLDGTARFDTVLTVGTLTLEDGRQLPLDGINRPLSQDEIVLLTPSFGARAAVSEKATVVPLTRIDLPIRLGQELVGVADAAGPGDPDRPIPLNNVLIVGSGKGGEALKAAVQAGMKVGLRFDLVSNPLRKDATHKEFASRAGLLRGKIAKSLWNDVANAVGGGPWLVRDGQLYVDADLEGFKEAGFTQARHPRSAVGVTATGELLLVTVDGRQGFSQGISLPDLAQRMKDLGAVQAINLDGGGSTTMVVRDLYVNGPSDGTPRPVASALLVFAETAKEQPDEPEETVEPVIIQAGSRLSLQNRLPLPVGAPNPNPQQNAARLWGTKEGKGFVDQAGNLTALRAGAGTVYCVNGHGQTQIPILVQAGPPSRLTTALQPVANNPPDRNQIAVTVTDTYGNPVRGQVVRIQVSGGVAERTEIVTDEKGKAAVEVVWDVEKGRRAVVTAGALTSVAAPK